MIRLARLPSAALLLLLSSPAFASVGEVSVLEGHATRAPGKDAAPVDLKVGSPIEQGDVLKVDAGGNLKLTLTDKSVLMVAGGSELTIDEARFKGLERESFSIKLALGKVWAHVSKTLAGSDQNFEVKTDRAVAGVRGTIFRVDATKLFDQAQAKPRKAAGRSYTVVRVQDGKVAVNAKVAREHQDKADPQLLAQMGIKPGGPGPRHRVEGPKQISKEAWEAKFTELQKQQFVAVGEDLWHEGGWDPKTDQDAFARFVNKNSPPDTAE